MSTFLSRLGPALLGMLLFTLPARALVVPEGLSFEPPEGLDLTYQVLPSYDDKEKVIAGWAGERLQYFVAISRLPAGWTDAQAYQAGMARDLRAAWDEMRVGRRDSYRATAGLSGNVVEYIKVSTDPDRPSTTIFVHHLSDGQRAFVATVSVVPPATPARVFDEALRLMRSAGLGNRSEKPARSEDAFVGTWTIEERLPDGRIALARTELKADLSFRTQMQVGQQLVLEASGVWSRSANQLHWTYLYSQPALPAGRRDDIDTVVAAGSDIIIVRSTLSGKERTMRRAAGAAR
jgi:hypothetical protein